MANPNPIRVMLVDDHAMVRNGLGAFLMSFDDLELVGEAANGQEAVSLCEQVYPDVILMDLVMPVMDGAAATSVIRQRYPGVQVIALTSFKEKDLVQGALEAVAIGYLLKNVSIETLADAIRAAHVGKPTLAPEVAKVLIQAEKLERLARAILDAPSNNSTLSALLRENVPDMIPNGKIEIRVFPDRVLLCFPEKMPSNVDPVWQWLKTSSEAHVFRPGGPLPWGNKQPAGEALAVVPIREVEGVQPVGGIVLLQSQDSGSIDDLLPVVKSLAAQISSAVHSEQVLSQTLAQQEVARELAMAGNIQASFLPDAVPQLTGWQLAALLKPARETAGDFYDFLTLPNDKLGLLVADVAGKGLGSALYMALSRTLLRTYASEYPASPDLVFSKANRRVLSDTRAGLFITAFYGILDLNTGTLTYCNAGHNPPYLWNHRKDAGFEPLNKTGMALGVVEDASWEQKTVQLTPGDVLLLYTDGVTEAQSQEGELFGEERLLEVLRTVMGASAQELQDAVISTIDKFVGNSPQSDDITLIVLARDS